MQLRILPRRGAKSRNSSIVTPPELTLAAKLLFVFGVNEESSTCNFDFDDRMSLAFDTPDLTLDILEHFERAYLKSILTLRFS